ncbi:MAG TPA: imidazole glycerol phosphate synthase subunit HisH [Candidatus Competibacteraceae bacterium]|nr:imidazole glycerol phosphate synthase subunit HisH [Candidatus Competibacteraceae bacterium]
MASIAVIDYGMGNLRSVAKALEHVALPGQRVIITQRAADIEAADRVVLPGQSAIRDAMAELQRLQLVAVIKRAAAEKPFFGMCLGPQALLEWSEENGGVACLGVLPGRVQRFPAELRDTLSGERLKIPHMGWTPVHQTRAHELWRDIPQDSRFYFVHSYYLKPAEEALIAGETEYGLRFASAIAHDYIFAVQFHPEKSAQAGLQLLANFCRWQPR